MCHFQILLGIFLAIIMSINGEETEEAKAEKYLKEIEDTLSSLCYKEMDTTFDYNANMKPENADTKAAAAQENTDFKQKVQKKIMEEFPNWKKYKNDYVRYQVKILLPDGPANMSKNSLEKMQNLQNEISRLHASSVVCEWRNKSNCNLRLNPEISGILKTSRDPAELEYYWTEWQNASGSAVPPSMYEELTNLYNMNARGNGFENTFDSWLAEFDDHSSDWSSGKFESEIHSLLRQLKPYYHKLHAYVRMKLKQSRGSKLELPSGGYLPNHLVGTFFAHDFTSLAAESWPYPNVTSENVDEALVKANYTPRRIVQAAEAFFQGLNKDWKLSDTFWEKSLLERPEGEDRAVSCHPTAYDLCAKQDFRLHMCVKTTENNLKTAYHEVGHIIYFMEYNHLPFALRNGANPGFHEAIGDTISLSVTPKHLKCVLGLSIDSDNKIRCDHQGTNEINQEDINVLYQSALSKFPFLYFALAVDIWRNKVFNGSLTPSEYNNEWWRLRKDLQGIVPPSPRPANLIDAMALFHIASNVPYTAYIVSHILQYQFYEAMCIAAGEFNPDDPKSAPLHRCDFSHSEKAGKLLKDMLQQGASNDWKKVLENFTGSREISLRPMIHYFKPLFDVIEKELKENNFRPCFGDEC